jgi:hypothetical protein
MRHIHKTQSYKPLINLQFFIISTGTRDYRYTIADCNILCSEEALQCPEEPEET